MSKEYYDEETDELVIEFDDTTPKETIDFFSNLLREARLESEARGKANE
jgi:hypothetical protein